MNRNGIINGVKVKMDEMTPDGVSVPFEESIGPVLDDCAKELLRVAPLHILPHTNLVLTSMTYDTANFKAYIPIPTDFIRIGRVLFPRWEKAVTVAVKIDSPEYVLQNNKYTRGGYSRPVVALVNKGTNLIECSKVDGSVILEKTPSEATYIKTTLPELLPDVLIDTLEWLAVSNLLQITGDLNGTKLAQARYEQSLKLL